tara:strand:+ start:13749 stop:16325 length:2577 start_codon:yes stop_codon:yes gene_type:complete
MSESIAMIERALKRDAAIRAAGADAREFESYVVDLIVENKGYEDAATRNWLIARAVTENSRVAGRLVRATCAMLELGHAKDAATLFRRLLDMDKERGDANRIKHFLGERSILRQEVETLLGIEHLVSRCAESIGTLLVALQSSLLLAEYNDRNQTNTTEPDRELDCHAHYWFYQTDNPEREGWGLVAKAIERGLCDLTEQPSVQHFAQVSNQLLDTKWGLAVCQPISALYDWCVRTKELQETWQRTEAIRLLSDPRVEAHYAAYPWRRLLRQTLLSSLSNEELTSILLPIRNHQENERVVANELSDLSELGVLTTTEIAIVDRAREEGTLFDPTDPRDLRSRPRVSGWSSEPEEPHYKKWPHPNEHKYLEVLEDSSKTFDTSSTQEIEVNLLPRLEALNVILARDEVDMPEWRGHCLIWCTGAVRDIKKWCCSTHGVEESSGVPLPEYINTLNTQAAWWEGRAKAALGNLDGDVPDSHRSRHSESIGWDTNDAHATSLKFLDELLAVPDGSYLDSYRAKLSTIISGRWHDWPSFTRALTITTLRTYYWSRCGGLRDLLVDTVHHGTCSQDLEFAFSHLLRLGYTDIARLLQSLVDRLPILSGPSDIAYGIAHTIGNAVVRANGRESSSKTLIEIRDYFHSLSADSKVAGTHRPSIVFGIIESAKETLASWEELYDQDKESWRTLVTWSIVEWLGFDSEQQNHLPVQLMTSIREMHWSTNQKRSLFEGFSASVLNILQNCELGSFYDMHHELRGVLEDEVNDSVSTRYVRDDLLLEFCAASAQRVANWRLEGRTTNDLAYRFSLSGTDTCNLMWLAFQSCRDRDNARRELAPAIDMLADAGMHDAASDIRTRLRHFTGQ